MSKSEENSQIENFPVVYSGVIPCADCPGIDYTLVLEENHFTEWSHYIDRSQNLFHQEGTWTLKSDTLKLYTPQGDINKTFLYDEQNLSMLDHNLQKINGELEGNYQLTRSPEEESIRSHHAELRNEGVDFIASGNEPFWNVQIYSNDKLIYKTPETERSFPISELSKEVNDETTTYRSDEFNLTYTPGFCRDSMSGFLFTHVITLNFAGRTLEGCGKNL